MYFFFQNHQTSATFYCLLSCKNSFYKLFNNFSWIPEPPEEPRHLKVLEATSSTARLSWERPNGLQTNSEDEQLPIKSFTIELTPIQGKPQ